MLGDHFGFFHYVKICGILNPSINICMYLCVGSFLKSIEDSCSTFPIATVASGPLGAPLTKLSAFQDVTAAFVSFIILRHWNDVRSLSRTICDFQHLAAASFLGLGHCFSLAELDTVSPGSQLLTRLCTHSLRLGIDFCVRIFTLGLRLTHSGHAVGIKRSGR